MLWPLFFWSHIAVRSSAAVFGRVQHQHILKQTFSLQSNKGWLHFKLSLSYHNHIIFSDVCVRLDWWVNSLNPPTCCLTYTHTTAHKIRNPIHLFDFTLTCLRSYSQLLCMDCVEWVTKPAKRDFRRCFSVPYLLYILYVLLALLSVNKRCKGIKPFML